MIVHPNHEPGKPCGYASREECAKEGAIRNVMVRLDQDPKITSLTFICVIQRKEEK